MYLMCGYAATLALVLVGCRVSLRTVPALRGVGRLSWALSFGLAAVLLVAMRPFLPAWITILVANELLFISVLFIYAAVADTLAVPMRFLPWGVGLLAPALAVNAYFTYIQPDLTVRILNCSGLCAVYAVATAMMLFRYEDHYADRGGLLPTLRFATEALAWLQILTAVQHIARGVLTVLYPPGDLIHLDLIQFVFSYTNMTVNLGTGCGLIWLALCIHRRDLQMIAQSDSMTGLLNRRAFDEILARELRRANHTDRSLVLLLLDIDRFKVVNDVWGHQAGDEVIRRVSSTLLESLRPSDTIARVGGEEFAGLLRDASWEQVEEVAERLRMQVAGLMDLPGGVQITISIGVAQSDQDETPEDLFRRCDKALYRSKEAGRNLVTVSGSLSRQSVIAAQTV
ncbi:MAG TPA: GGDEF domain-containing protein [Acidobacteriaceae bacterium]